MNSNKISLIIVLLSFVIAGGFVVAAKLPTDSGDGSSIADSSSEESSSESPEENADTSSENESSSETSDPDSSSNAESSSDSSSEQGNNDNTLPRDENGKELPVDVMPIVEAYNTGDTSSLTDKELATLEAAKQVIEEIITDDMSDYDKALAIHDYIILNNEYNDNILNIFGVSSLDDSSPYGMLIKKTTVCKGYATTFKLLCNMCGIECELIVEYEGKDIHHAYDGLNIGGYWYYTDVTWDDDESSTTADRIGHQYFNITKEQMSADHELDESCPDTESDKYSYAANNIINIDSEEAFESVIREKLDKRALGPIFIRPGKDLGLKLKYHGDSNGYDYDFESEENIDRLREKSDNNSGAFFIEYSQVSIDGETILRLMIY